MPEKFLDQQRRTNHTRPIMNDRDTDVSQFSDFATNGVGVVTGFVCALTSPISTSIQVSKGRAIGPRGDEVRVAPTSITGTSYQKALTADSSLVNVKDILESLSGAYATLDPTSHDILITLETATGRVRALKITNAEKTAIDAAIGAGETGEASADFDAATADHRARGNATLKDPDGVPGTDGQLPTTSAFTEYVLATVSLDATGGDIDTVTLRRERKQNFTDMTT